MKKIFIIGGLLFIQHISASASEDRLDYNRETRKIGEIEETFFFPKEYITYDAFKQEYVTSLLAERLKILSDFTKLKAGINTPPTYSSHRKLLDVNENSLRSNIENADLFNKVFGKGYNNQSIKADHTINVASVLKDRLPEKDKDDLEKLDALILQIKSWKGLGLVYALGPTSFIKLEKSEDVTSEDAIKSGGKTSVSVAKLEQESAEQDQQKSKLTTEEIRYIKLYEECDNIYKKIVGGESLSPQVMSNALDDFERLCQETKRRIKKNKNLMDQGRRGTLEEYTTVAKSREYLEIASESISIFRELTYEATQTGLKVRLSMQGSTPESKAPLGGSEPNRGTEAIHLLEMRAEKNYQRLPRRDTSASEPRRFINPLMLDKQIAIIEIIKLLQLNPPQRAIGAQNAADYAITLGYTPTCCAAYELIQEALWHQVVSKKPEVLPPHVQDERVVKETK